MRSPLFLLATGTVLFGAGCGNHFTPSPRMADAPAAPLATAADAATLVFVRPSKYAGVMNPSLFIDGKYAGEIEAERQIVVTVPPGEHEVVSGMTDFTAMCRQLNAKLDAGKIYFVEATTANGADLFAARQADAPKLKGWLALAPISRKVDAAGLSAHPVDASGQAECAKKAAAHLADDDPEDKAKHVVNPADGFTAAP